MKTKSRQEIYFNISDMLYELNMSNWPQRAVIGTKIQEYAYGMMQKFYEAGYKEGYEQREAEYGSEQSDNDQAAWERGYRDGMNDGRTEDEFDK